MSRIAYIERKFKAPTLAIIEQADEIIAEYRAQGYVLTLRQLYYQFVSRDLIRNKQSEYKRLGSIISDARRAGLIDWEAIEDRTRNLETISSWRNPAAIVDVVAEQYKIDLWQHQPYYVEVWFEKDALIGVFERVAEELRLPYFSCRGYTSDSEVWGAARRLGRIAQGGREPIVLHFGDHDPSGLDMTRDIEERLWMFGRAFGGLYGKLQVRRLALNMDQIEEYDPPPNPAKDTDARFERYREEFGDESWELDALEPSVLAALVRDEVESLIEPVRWADDQDRETLERDLLAKVSERWGEVVAFLDDDEDEG